MLESRKALKKGAVTGGISSGKSSVCSFFQKLGAYVVSADEIVHELLSSNQKIIEEVVGLLGKEIFLANNLTENTQPENTQIDRKKIAQIVFKEPKKLKSLENILHPVVQEEIKKQYLLKKSEGIFPLFIAEVPLLFETNSDKFFDFTICVVADRLVSQERFNALKNQEGDAFTKREKRQLPVDQKIEKADYIIHNHGSLKDLKEAVDKLYLQLINDS